MNWHNQSKISMINCVIDRIIEYIEALKKTSTKQNCLVVDYDLLGSYI